MDRKDHIGFELRGIQNLISEIMKADREQDSICVTQLQHWIIRYLDEHRDQDLFQKDMEEAFQTSRATISNTLQVMERNGLIERKAVQHDARLKKLNLTESSEEFTRRARQNVERMEALLRKGMMKEEEQVFMETLRRIHHNLEEELQNIRREN